MTEDGTAPQVREALSYLDAEMLTQIDRAKEVEIARINSEGMVKADELRAQAATDRRQRISWALAGLAVVAVLLGVVAAIWTSVDRERAVDLQRERLLQETAQQCIRAGNIWTSAGDCLITQR